MHTGAIPRQVEHRIGMSPGIQRIHPLIQFAIVPIPGLLQRLYAPTTKIIVKLLAMMRFGKQDRTADRDTGPRQVPHGKDMADRRFVAQKT